MKTLFTTLDSHPAIFWCVAIAVTLSAAGGLWRIARADRERPSLPVDCAVAAMVLAVLVAWRWPSLLEVRHIGLREADALAAAMIVRDAPQHRWLADPIGGGPLAVLALLPTHALGVRLDDFNARLVGLLMDWGALVAAWVLLRRTQARGVAVAAIGPLVLGWAATSSAAVVEYSAAHLIWLLAACAAVSVQMARDVTAEPGRSGRRHAMAAGVAVGLLPFCGGGGVAVAIGAIGAGMVAMAGIRFDVNPERRAAIGWFGGTTAYTVALVVSWLHGQANLTAFWMNWRADPLGLEAWLLAGAPVAPGLWLGVAAAVLVAALGSRRSGRFGGARVAASVGLLVAAGFITSAMVLGTPEPIGRLAEYWRRPRSTLGDRLRSFARAGDRMAVWGQRSQLHVETGLAPAARSTDTPRESATESGECRAYFRARYLADLRSHQPVFFVDAVPRRRRGASTAALSSHEALPELAAWIRENYTLVSDDAEARVFVRVEAARARNLGRPGVVPLLLANMIRKDAKVPPFYLDPTRIFAHAPSVLSYAIPAGAWSIKGRFGFQEAAYTNPGTPTDGAIFAIETVDAAGRRKRLFERHLTPKERVADRAPGEFTVDLWGGSAREVELIIESGATQERDWTYWEGLRFEGTPE